MTPHRTSVSATSPETPDNGLQDAVTELAQNVRVLTDLVQEVREDLNWISHNGVPHQTVTVRLEPALSTSAEDSGELRAVVTAASPPAAGSSAAADDLQEAFEWLVEHVGELLQEQLNLILSGQDQLRIRIVEAVHGKPQSSHSRSASRSNSPTDVAATKSASPRPDSPRSLFTDDFAEQSAPPTSTAVTATHEQPVEFGAVAQRLLAVRPWEIGEAVEFCWRGQEVSGEIIALDDATNRATVRLITMQGEVTVSQDDLRPEQVTVRRGDDPLAGQPEKAPRGGESCPSADSPFTPSPNSASADTDPGAADSIALIAARATGPYSLARCASVRERLQQGTITPQELQHELGQLIADRDAFLSRLTQRLSRSQLRELSGRLGSPVGNRTITKATLARDCFDAVLKSFALDRDLTWHPASETYEAAVSAAVAGLSDADLQAYAARTDLVQRPVGEFVWLLSGSGR